MEIISVVFLNASIPEFEKASFKNNPYRLLEDISSRKRRACRLQKVVV